MASRLDPKISSTRQPRYNESRSKCRDDFLKFTEAKIEDDKTNNSREQFKWMTLLERSTRVKPCSFSRLQ
ncbi:hypothetical protein BT93_E2319 [Corymbia citriodora subsp. variegata]|nr:hypothetical protein BT93_E2319 [Corymbia citriodora subsp. variegata]